jgi:hypothetical protein
MARNVSEVTGSSVAASPDDQRHDTVAIAVKTWPSGHSSPITFAANNSSTVGIAYSTKALGMTTGPALPPRRKFHGSEMRQSSPDGPHSA